MPFHRLLNKYIGDNFSNFMTQYEATRTVSETILESMPQLGLQIYMIIYCRTYGCNFQTDGDDGDDTALVRAFIISISCIVYRIVLTWYEIQKENITLKEYFIQLIKMGEGIPLSKIANNEIDKLDLTDMDLTVAQVRLLIKVLENNTSLKMLEMPWKKLDDESIHFIDREYEYWTKTTTKGNYSIKLRKKIGTNKIEEIWNGDKEKEKLKTEYFGIGDLEVSFNDKFLGYSLDLKGSEYYTIYIRDIKTNNLITDKIEDTAGGITFSLNDKYIYYSKLDENHRPKKYLGIKLGPKPNLYQTIPKLTMCMYYLYRL